MSKTVVFLIVLIITGIIFAQVRYSDYANLTMKVLDVAPEQPKEEVVKTKKEWQEQLSEVEFHVLRDAGTEPPHSSIYKDFAKHGTGEYYCVACGANLFSSKTKFDSGSGWPSFYDAVHDNIKLDVDYKIGYKRTEIRCGKCDSHLGHLFEGEDYGNPINNRYCINGVCLSFLPSEEGEDSDSTEKETK